MYVVVYGRPPRGNLHFPPRRRRRPRHSICPARSARVDGRPMWLLAGSQLVERSALEPCRTCIGRAQNGSQLAAPSRGAGDARPTWARCSCFLLTLRRAPSPITVRAPGSGSRHNLSIPRPTVILSLCRRKAPFFCNGTLPTTGRPKEPCSSSCYTTCHSPPRLDPRQSAQPAIPVTRSPETPFGDSRGRELWGDRRASGTFLDMCL